MSRPSPKVDTIVQMTNGVFGKGPRTPRHPGIEIGPGDQVCPEPAKADYGPGWGRDTMGWKLFNHLPAELNILVETGSGCCRRIIIYYSVEEFSEDNIVVC